MPLNKQKLIENCASVLEKNFREGYTVPSVDLYPHQWLWDSCFTAIGLRHIDLKRAQQELISLKRGAWSNGMLPNIIFHDSFVNYDHTLWQSKTQPEAPHSFNTTGITQPPMLAEAVLKIGEKLKKSERVKWYKTMFETIVNYHTWLYRERDPEKNGLIVQLHPYESGLDNSPPWMTLIEELNFPWWVRAFNLHSSEVMINHLRRDTAHIPSSQRIGLKEAIECFYLIRKLTENKYRFSESYSYKLPVMQDLAFICILIRANECLKLIAKDINKKLDSDLLTSMERTSKSLSLLWDENEQTYFSRNYATKKLIRKHTISSLLPIYAGAVTKKRAKTLVDRLNDKFSFSTGYPIPSVPINTHEFNPERYWQGPTWLNTNWLVYEGLIRYGYKTAAKNLKESSLQMVWQNGTYEYFSPINGKGEGAANFSWTAALVIDLAKEK